MFSALMELIVSLFTALLVSLGIGDASSSSTQSAPTVDAADAGQPDENSTASHAVDGDQEQEKTAVIISQDPIYRLGIGMTDQSDIDPYISKQFTKVVVYRIF